MRYLLSSTLGAVLTTLILSPQPAEAFTIALDPKLCTLSSDCTTSDYQGSTAELHFSFADVVEGVLIEVAIANTTSKSLGSTLVGVAFDLPDFVASLTYDQGSSAYGQLYKDAELPPFGGSFDVGVRSRDETQLMSASVEQSRLRMNFSDYSFAGGHPTAGVLAGEATVISFIVDAGDRNAKMVGDYLYDGYLNQYLRAVGRFQQVSFQGQDNGRVGQHEDKVLGIVKPPKPPREVPEASGLLGLVAIAGMLALSGRRK